MMNSPQPWLPPVVISWKADAKFGEYICRRTSTMHQPLITQVLYLEHTDGLRKPTGPFPIASRASLIRVIIDATTGEEQEVPKTSSNSPSIPVRGRENDFQCQWTRERTYQRCSLHLFKRSFQAWEDQPRELRRNVPVSRQIRETARLHRRVVSGSCEKMQGE